MARADHDLLGAAEVEFGRALDATDAWQQALIEASAEQTQASLCSMPAEVRPSVFGSLAWRPHIRSRHDVSFLVVRSWLASARDGDLQQLKLIKAELPADTIARAADDIAAAVSPLIGLLVRHVVPVTCGHSRRPDCFSFRLANAVADALEAQFVPCFKPRLLAGSSHPKANFNLPPLEFAADPPSGATLVVDDLTTTGFHMHEAIAALRAQGTPTLGVAWIGGTIRS
jgi:hypothetical protein